MRIILSFALLIFVADGLLAQDYLTKDGKLTEQLKVVQLQGGFAGFTGFQYTIAPDGSWTSESIFQQKAMPKDKGKLSEKDLAKLAATLKKCDLANLPEKTDDKTVVNPFKITVEFGKQKAAWIGQDRPKVDQTNLTATVDSRFAGVLEGVAGLLTPPAPKEKKEKEQSKRTLDHFQKTLDKSFTPEKTVASFGEPDRRLGSGLIIFEYDLDDGAKMRLGFPGFAPIMYAHYVQGSGESVVIPVK